jgi:hypothetical protein
MKFPLYFLLLALPAVSSRAHEIREDFASDPAEAGWRRFGNASLFAWNPATQDLAVTWDSSQPNSYFYQPLQTVLTARDDARFGFDLRLKDVVVGVNPARPFTFELAIGLLNLSEATATNFWRGTATQSPDLVEFDYFPDSGFGATISTIIVSSNNQFIPSFSFPLELTVGDLFHVELSYVAAKRTLSTVMQRNGQPFGPIKDVVLGSTFTDFRADTFAISSYNDAGADGSIFAHGSVDNLDITVPDPPLTSITGTLSGSQFQVQFIGQTNWFYLLERTDDWQLWQAVSAPSAGTGAIQVLKDSSSPAPERAFYRVRAERSE